MAQKPMIHLNGSGIENLAQGYFHAMDAIIAAMDALRLMYPHMRDYYPLPDSKAAYRAACKEHQGRLDKLESIRADIEELSEALQDAINFRDRQRGGR